MDRNGRKEEPFRCGYKKLLVEKEGGREKLPLGKLGQRMGIGEKKG